MVRFLCKQSREEIKN